jgi:hypothetical protein
MLLRWRKLDEHRHAFAVVRDGLPEVEAVLETRSFLVHDFAHFAVEQQAQLVDGFYGALARGLSFAELRDDVALPPEHERWHAERLAARFQPVWRAVGTPAFDGLRHAYAAGVGVDEAFVDGAVERMRQLMGHWRATPFGSVMERRW